MKQRNDDYDVVIIGAGMVGLTLACQLINKGLNLSIVDKKDDYFGDKKSACLTTNLRVSSITLGSQQILEQCGAWQALPKSALASFQRMEIWEQTSTSHLFFDAAEVGQSHLGSIVKNHDLQMALLTQARAAPELDWFFSESLHHIQHEKDSTLLSLTSGELITTRLLVGADGAQSYVRQLVGIQTKQCDYLEKAIIATVRTALAHEWVARQIFLAEGTLAFLPLSHPHYSSIVWSIASKEADRLTALSDELFCLELTNAFERRLGAIESTSSRLSFPLKAQQCEQYVKPGVALIGDAAHTLHPLAGQGVNLGFADAASLANVILEAKRKERALGALHTLRRYERERRFHHQLMGGGGRFNQTRVCKFSFFNERDENVWIKFCQ